MRLRGRLNLVNEQFFFVTTTVVKFTPIFAFDSYCDIIIENIKHYQKRYNFDIPAYVIIPTHFHWILKTEPKMGTVSDIMRDIKKFTAWEIFDRLEAGLVERPEEYKYSSARNYLNKDHSVIKVYIDYTGVEII